MKILTKDKILFRLYDYIILIASFPLSVTIRFGSFSYPKNVIAKFYTACFIVSAIKLLLFHLSTLPKSIWRHSGIYDLFYIVRFSLGASLASGIALFLYNRLEDIPRSSLIIDFLLTITLLGGARLAIRLLLEKELGFQWKNKKGKKTIVVGGKLAARELLKVFKTELKSRYFLVGLLDDDRHYHGQFIQGVKVIGGVSDLKRVIATHQIESVFFVTDKMNSKISKQITDVCLDHNLELKKLPLIKNIATGSVSIQNLRPVKIEDILGRKSVKLDTSLIHNMLSNQTIMITGGGGSIGSELCRQVATFNPKKLIIFEACEFFIFNIENELRLQFPKAEIIPVVGDVRDIKKVEWTIQTYRPNVLIHAAAYKHVPLMEQNPEEAFKTNILGTKCVAQTAAKFGVERFVMVSTDKAVNPTSVMGATKRIAEMICKDLQKKTKTKFMTVRFGNVLGSNGSVIPYFLQQIEKGGPVTVTHPEITRFFMTIAEASQLVLQAGAMGSGGEIFVLEMGESVKILELAKDLIKLAGFEVEDIGIEFTGLRPGEKLYEEVLSTEENTTKTFHPQVLVALTRDLPINFEQQIEKIEKNISSLDYYEEVKRLVPEYIPRTHLN